MSCFKKNIFLSLFLVLLVCISAFSEELKIAGSEWPPYQTIDKATQKESGYATEILQTALTKLKIQHNIKYFKWSLAVETTKQGTFDLLYSASYKKDRAEIYYYPKEPLHLSEYVFFIRKQDEGKITYSKNFAELNAYKIGIVKEYAYSDDFLKYCGERKDIAILSSDIMGFGMLQTKQIDIFPCEKLNGVALLKDNDKFKAEDFIFIDNPFIKKEYFVLASKNSKYPDIQGLLKNLDKTILEMKNNGEIKKIEMKYLK